MWDYIDKNLCHQYHFKISIKIKFLAKYYSVKKEAIFVKNLIGSKTEF
jgi:hypothetical protein